MVKGHILRLVTTSIAGKHEGRGKKVTLMRNRDCEVKVRERVRGEGGDGR